MPVAGVVRGNRLGTVTVSTRSPGFDREPIVAPRPPAERRQRGALMRRRRLREELGQERVQRINGHRGQVASDVLSEGIQITAVGTHHVRWRVRVVQIGQDVADVDLDRRHDNLVGHLGIAGCLSTCSDLACGAAVPT